MSIGWICVSIMTMFVALSMAEVVSAVPTSGGPYHWCKLLSSSMRADDLTSVPATQRRFSRDLNTRRSSPTLQLGTISSDRPP